MNEDLDQFCKDELNKIKKRFVSKCKRCNGIGLYEDDACDCLKKYFYYVELAAANIPREYWFAEMKNFHGDKLSQTTVEKYIANMDVALKKGLGLTFLGSYGRGKTFLCILILKAAIRQKYSVYFATMAELIKFIQDGFSNPDKVAFYNSRVKKANFLCIDNLGSEYRNLSSFGSFTAAEFDILIRFRKGNLLPTFLTTNLTSEKFTKYYGNSVKSLLTACNKERVVAGDDFRDQLGKEWDKQIIEK